MVAFDRAAVREVAPLPELSIPPSLPPSIEGVLNLAGSAVLVVGLGRTLGLTTAEQVDPIYQHLVVLAGADEGLALRVDRVEDVRQIDDDAVVAIGSESSFNGCVTGHADLNIGKVHILDAGRILLIAEREWLAELRQVEQQRLDGLVSA